MVLKKAKKILAISIFLFIFVAPSYAAETNQKNETPFKAKIIDVIREIKKENENGKEIVQQILRLKGEEGELKNKEFIYDGTALDAEIAGQNLYKKGDVVLVLKNINVDGTETFFINDFVRTGNLYFLTALFGAIVLLVGKKQGIKALIGLAATFIILMKFIIPKILAGSNPLLISIIGSLIILLITLYLVHGFNSKTSIALIGTLISLLFTGILSVIFTNLTRLTGFGEEEAAYLLNIGQNAINIKGVLLAGMIIGALGVLDDITVSQASITEQIYKANQNLSKYEIYKRAMKVGVDHVSSIVNTLVLAYAGASLPVLLLLGTNDPSAIPLSQAINNEAIATEIVRTIVGSMGLVVAVPITTFVAVYFFKKKIIKPETETPAYCC